MIEWFFIGRPNVGKSSLLNRLLGDRIQIVSNIPGTTIDNVFRRVNDSVTLVDTRGIESVKQLEEFLNLTGCRYVCLILEAPTGISSLELEFLKLLLRKKVKTVLVFNKSDLGSLGNLEYRSIPYFYVSAKTGEGILQLKEYLLPRDASFVSKKSLTISLVGRTNVGKSSLFNLICQRQLATVSPKAHTTRDFLEYYVRYHGMNIRIFDCAGFKKGIKKTQLEAYVANRVSKAIEFSDVISVVISAEDGVTTLDKKIMSLISKRAKRFFVVVNKWDLANGAQTKDFIKAIPAFVSVIFTTALKQSSSTKILSTAIKIWEWSVDNQELTDLVNKVIQSFPPPLLGSKLNDLLGVRFECDTIFLKFKNNKAVPQNYLRGLKNRVLNELFPGNVKLDLRLKLE